MKEITIARRKVGKGYPPFIIAEMSGNHNHYLERALAIVDAAAQAGSHALKLQTYTADTMTIDRNKGEFLIKDKKSLWRGKSLYQLYQQAATPYEWHKVIFDRCRKHGIIGFSSPFDVTAVDFLEGLNVPCYKIASFELVDLPLIAKVGSTGKPIIMSTGMATLQEIKEAVNTAQKAGCQQIILLKCTSTYPALPENTNLLTIPDMQKRFGCQVGLSDHTLGIGVAIAGVALGATVIERHFTLSRAEGGVDASFSLEPAELEELVEETFCAWQSLGKVSYGPTAQDKKSLIFRRSVYVVRDIAAGELFTSDNIKVIRPGLGLMPRYYKRVLGQMAKRPIRRGTALNWTMIERQGGRR